MTSTKRGGATAQFDFDGLRRAKEVTMDIGEIQRIWEVEPVSTPTELPDPEPVPAG